MNQSFLTPKESPINDIRTIPRPQPPVLPLPARVELPRPPKCRPPICLIGLVVLAIIVSLMASFSLGWRQGRRNNQASARPAPPTQLELPKGATMIAQCVPGRGTQYILPKDIPQGPIYNVWQGKVIGIEFMFDKNSLLNGHEYIGLPLQSIAYNHISIGLLTSGHAGFEGAHYHMDLFTVPREKSAQITCP